MDYDLASEKRAVARAGVTTTGIGIGFDHATTRAADDVIRWLSVASDGSNVGPLEIRVAKSEISHQIPKLAVERAVERYAGRFAANSRLLGLLAASPIHLRSEDFRDSDFEFAEDGLSP